MALLTLKAHASFSRRVRSLIGSMVAGGICLVSGGVPVTAQWTEMNGPNDFVSSIVKADGSLYAISMTDGIFRTENNGASWTKLDIGEYNHVAAVAAAGTAFFAAAGDSILSIPDGGKIPSPPALNLVRDMATDGSVLYAGGSGGVYSTSDRGAHWTIMTNGLTDTNVTKLGLIGNVLHVGTAKGNVFSTSDNGVSWTASTSGLPAAFIRCFTECAGALFAGNDSGLFRSDDKGENWTAVNVGLKTGILSLYVTGSMVFAGAKDGVFRSPDNGTTWSAANAETPLLNVNTFLLLGDTLWAGNNDEGVVFSTDNGTTWTIGTGGLSHMWVPSLFVSGGSIFAGTTLSAYRSTDGGVNWVPINDGLTPYLYVKRFREHEGAVYAATEDGAVYRFNENGSDWTAVTAGGPDTGFISFVIKGNDIFAATESCGVFQTVIGGSGWTAVNTGFPQKTRLVALAENGGTLLAATYDDGVFSSENDGDAWTTANTGLDEHDVLELASDNGVVYAGTFNGVYRTADNGAHWEAVNSGIENRGIYYLTISGTLMFAGGYNCLFMSVNDGKTWAVVDTEFRSNALYSVAVTGEYVFAGTSTALFRQDRATMMALPVIACRPARESGPGFVCRNVPHGSPCIGMALTIPSDQMVSVKVYSVTGRLVASIVNGRLPAGIHAFQWNTESIAAGRYAVRMKTASGTRVQGISVCH